MNSRSKTIDFVNIDCDGNYFNTSEQSRLRSQNWFVESSIPSTLTGSTVATGFFERRFTRLKSNSLTNQSLYATGSTIQDSSGNERKILSSDNDYIVSSSLDAYKHGIEILRQQDWTAGLAKISAGTPGHLFEKMRYGIGGDVNLSESQNAYVELEVFNPVAFVQTGGDPNRFTYPIFIKSDSAEANGSFMDGVIEPLSLRTVVFGRSIDIPFDSHSFKGQCGNGNVNWRGASDCVLSVDFRNYSVNKSFYLDAFGSPLAEVQVSSFKLNPAQGFINTDENLSAPFEDVEYSSTGTTYVADNQHSATCGFVYNNATAGTDSIAYGGLLY